MLISINERVERIKGNKDEIDKLVEEYKPFIASCTEKFTGNFVEYGKSDELSIALIAFVESIECYDSTKGNFLSFAQGVMKRRLVDFYRKEKRHNNVVSLNVYKETDDDEEIDLSEQYSLEKYSMDEVSKQRKFEIEDLKKELLKWDIKFEELVHVSPKHKTTREVCGKAIKMILSRQDIIECIKVKKYFPVSEIANGLKISRRKLERLRKYIIASVIILTGDYQYIREYLKDYGQD